MDKQINIRIDSPTDILAAAVAAQDGACLMCKSKPACYCGLWCAGQCHDHVQYPGAYCVVCGDYPSLYCSIRCAQRGR